MTDKPVVNAAVAVLEDTEGRVLLAQRPEGKPWAGWWEFPGGKIEAGETAHAALLREIREELGVTIHQAYPWVSRQYEYPERQVNLHFFRVTGWHGEPSPCEGQQLSWQLPSQVEVQPLLPANLPLVDMLCLPSVYAITHYAGLGESFWERLQRALASGLRLIQVREKQLDGTALERFTRRVVELAKPYGARVVLNADNSETAPANAQAWGADGVHLSSQALAALQAKPDGMLVGASCHHADDLAKAAALGLDFVVLSPVQATPSHPEAIPLGWPGFTGLIRHYALPVYALGGMRSTDLDEARQAGAHGIALQRAIWGM